ARRARRSHGRPGARCAGAALRRPGPRAVPARRLVSQRLPDRSLAGPDRPRHPARSGAHRRLLAGDRPGTGSRPRAPAGRLRTRGMVMKRFLLVLAALTPLGAGACNKPTPDDCRKAITNMERLLGTEAAARNADNEGEVRRCRGGSTKEAVACAIKA